MLKIDAVVTQVSKYLLNRGELKVNLQGKEKINNGCRGHIQYH